MVLTKYTSVIPPEKNLRVYLGQEHSKISLSISSIIDILKALDVPIEIGAPNSGGAGFRMLRIPN